MATELEASVGITKNIGNYESLRLDAQKRVTLEPGANEDEAWTELWKNVQDQIEAQLLEASATLG